ncbi:MvdC/MvdD family ATP grasp protein [Actinomadura harenae]|uniref:MvdD-like pre-ATP grasp domain-containing protein n=1 Tax=Actinomadura harenae TaxID=2483351 RepID=A0A3M2LGV4_9ACTN|nr:hypothetical protein [Actinomadura harenae]RMI36729.1 hypothetical protein EBO15_37770 [Actinomadura harenae]
MGAPAVLMLAEQGDAEAVSVADVLAARGVPVAWFDTAWFPTRAAVTARLGAGGWDGEVTTPGGVIRFDEVTAVYYRQPQPFTFPAGLSEPERRFATVEARFGLGGLFMALPARWVSHPARLADAEYRPLQMATAARCGFTLPSSILTNDPGHAAAFTSSGNAVYKATMHKLISEADRVKLIYTTPVTAAATDDRVSTTMHLFQNNVPKSHDVRLVATGSGHLHAIAIHTADPAGRQDFRRGYGTLRYEITGVPDRVARACRAYLAALGLELGVFDFAVTDDGAWWFLECGPGAQWSWLQAETGAPIAAAVADILTGVPT